MKICLICDDHAIMREAMAATISRIWPDVTIIEAADFPSSWKEAERKPDLCLCDLSMPGSDSLAGIEALRAIQPEMPIIVVTGSANDAEMIALVKSGVAGFVQKSSTGPVIEAAIRLVLAGGTYIPPRVAELVYAAPQATDSPAFTPQQRRVLQLVARGQSNKEIANMLGIAPSTAKFHVDSLLEKLGVRNRAEATAKAIALGLS